MRRDLVLTSEASRHPFRAALPQRCFHVGEVENRRSWRLSFADDAGLVRQAAATYVAGFIATTVFFM